MANTNPTTTSVNLGQVSSYYAGTTPPTNTLLLWLDTTTNPGTRKIYDPGISGWVLETSGSGSNIPIQFIIGDGGVSTPVAGSTAYTNSSLASITSIFICVNGVGFLKSGVDYSLISGGGFTLLGGLVFSIDEVYTLFTN